MSETTSASDQTIEQLQAAFATMRDDFFALRLEKQTLESVLSSYAQPMVVSSSDEEEGVEPMARNNKKSRAALVVALPQGEALDRINQLLKENAKLASEINCLLQAANGETSGTASTLYARNKELETEVSNLEKRIIELESAHAGTVKSLTGKWEREMRTLRVQRNELEERLHAAEENATIEKELAETQLQQCKIDVANRDAENSILHAELDRMRDLMVKIVRNASESPEGVSAIAVDVHGA